MLFSFFDSFLTNTLNDHRRWKGYVSSYDMSISSSRLSYDSGKKDQHTSRVSYWPSLWVWVMYSIDIDMRYMRAPGKIMQQKWQRLYRDQSVLSEGYQQLPVIMTSVLHLWVIQGETAKKSILFVLLGKVIIFSFKSENADCVLWCLCFHPIWTFKLLRLVPDCWEHTCALFFAQKKARRCSWSVHRVCIKQMMSAEYLFFMLFFLAGTMYSKLHMKSGGFIGVFKGILWVLNGNLGLIFKYVHSYPKVYIHLRVICSTCISM